MKEALFPRIGEKSGSYGFQRKLVAMSFRLCTAETHFAMSTHSLLFPGLLHMHQVGVLEPVLRLLCGHWL